RDYYFPARELTGGLVYGYENTGTLPGSAPVEYTYYLGVEVDTALYLSVTQYSDLMEPKQQSRQEIKNDGIYLREITLLRPDTSGPVAMPTNLIHDQAFPFYLEEAMTDAYGYRLSFTDPATPDVLTYVSLDRKFSRDTTISVLGKNYPALLFTLAGEVSLRDPEAGDISPQFTGYEIYAKGLGLVEYRRELGGGAALGGRLKERITMAELIKRLEEE
ncbi:MAG: hypothetical protein AAF840_03325, partial [Bacteroidota bacterium]